MNADFRLTRSEQVANRFDEFTVVTPTSAFRLDRPPACLADYILAWLRGSDVVAWCEFDFDVFQMAIARIHEQWIAGGESHNPVLDYEVSAEPERWLERRVRFMFSIEDHPILDRNEFDRCCAAWKQRNWKS